MKTLSSSFLLLAAFTFAAFGNPATSFAKNPAEQSIAILDLGKQPSQIKKLLFEKKEFQLEDAPSDPFPSAILHGKFQDQDSSLLFESEKLRTKVEPSSSGAFELKVPLTAESTAIRFRMIEASGKIRNQDMTIRLASWKELMAAKEELKKRSSSRHVFVPSLGFTYLSYSESGDTSSQFSSVGLVGKVSYLFQLAPPRWDLGMTSYFTLMPLTTTPAEFSARYFGVNFRVGYKVTPIQSPWQFSVMAGYYYTTMLTGDGSFGFSNQGALQLFPVLRRTFSNGDSASTYFKFAPILSGLLPIGMPSHEWASGLSWSHLLKNGKNVSAAIDFANLKIEFDGTLIRTTSLSASVGYSL